MAGSDTMTAGSAGGGRERAVRRGGLSLFHVAGIEVRLDYSWFLVFALIAVSLATGYLPRAHPDLPTVQYWLAGLVATLLLFASILAHELSHAATARAAGIEVPAITLFLFGGVSHMEEEPASPAVDLRVALAGPASSLVLAALFWAVHAVLGAVLPALVSGVVLYLAWINAALAVFNLLPGLPLDGGRVLRALAWRRTGSMRRATRIAADVGKGIAVGLMLLGGLQIFSGALVGGLWLIFIGLFLRGTAEAGYQNLVMLRALEDVCVADVAEHEPPTVSPQLSLQELVDEHFLRHASRAFPVVEGGVVRGLISLRDLDGVPPAERASRRVGEFMAPASAVRVGPEVPLSQALEQLRKAPGDALLVLGPGEREPALLTTDAIARFLEIRRIVSA